MDEVKLLMAILVCGGYLLASFIYVQCLGLLQTYTFMLVVDVTEYEYKLITITGPTVRLLMVIISSSNVVDRG